MASLAFLARLGDYLQLRSIEGQPRRAFGMAVAVVFGAPLLLFVGGYIFLPTALIVLTVLVALAALGLLISLLLTWLGVLAELRYEIRRWGSV